MSLASVFVVLTLGQCAHSVPNEPYVRTDTDRCSEASLEPCLYWTRPTLVWQQNRLGNPDVPGDEEFEAVRRSFASWEQVLTECGNMTLVEGPLTDERATGYVSGRDDNVNLVLFRTRRCSAVVPRDDACWTDGSCANAYDCWSFDDQTIGITLTTARTTSTRSRTGRICNFST